LHKSVPNHKDVRNEAKALSVLYVSILMEKYLLFDYLIRPTDIRSFYARMFFQPQLTRLPALLRHGSQKNHSLRDLSLAATVCASSLPLSHSLPMSEVVLCEIGLFHKSNEINFQIIL